jgi:hypothetical protein
LGVPPNRLKVLNVFRCHVRQEAEVLMSKPSE